MMKTRIFACLFALTLYAQAREKEPSPKSTATTMKAVVLHQYGGPQALNYEAPRPEPRDDEVLIRVTRLIDDKKLTPVVTQGFPLSEVAKAQDQIATRHTRGKIVLRIAPNPKS